MNYLKVYQTYCIEKRALYALVDCKANVSG